MTDAKTVWDYEEIVRDLKRCGFRTQCICTNRTTGLTFLFQVYAIHEMVFESESLASLITFRTKAVNKFSELVKEIRV